MKTIIKFHLALIVFSLSFCETQAQSWDSVSRSFTFVTGGWDFKVFNNKPYLGTAENMGGSFYFYNGTNWVGPCTNNFASTAYCLNGPSDCGGAGGIRITNAYGGIPTVAVAGDTTMRVFDYRTCKWVNSITRNYLSHLIVHNKYGGVFGAGVDNYELRAGYPGSLANTQVLTNNTVYACDITTGQDSTPYVISFEYNSNFGSFQRQVRVYKYNYISDTWNELGNGAAVVPTGVYNVDFNTDRFGTTYLAFENFQTRKVNVLTFNGTIWVNVGSALSASTSYLHSMAVTYNGIPYVAYRDSVANAVMVKKYDGANWVDMGLPAAAVSGILGSLRLRTGTDNILYGAYHSNYDYIKIIKCQITCTSPNMPGAITGPGAALCGAANTVSTFSVPPVSGATSYSWVVPSGAAITGGQGTNSITVSYTPFEPGIVAVKANNACNSSNYRTDFVNGSPSAPTSISGTLSGDWCDTGTIQTYSTAAISGAISYDWVSPPGTTILSGQGTDTITLQIPPSFLTGLLSVKATNACGSSASTSAGITSEFTTPGPIIASQTTNLCNTIASFSIAPVSGAVSYLWTTTRNSTIVSGQGTTSVVVSFGAYATGSLAVQANNGCSLSRAKSIGLSGRPGAPASITGTFSGNWCATGSIQTYTASAVTGATSYTWVNPSGTTILSGQGTNSISLQIHAGFSWGQLQVTANNSCGSSSYKGVTLRTSVPTPGNITASQTSGLCNTSATFSISPISGATSYTWTEPTGSSIISGQGTTSISVTFTSFTSGYIRVTAHDVCASSAYRQLAITGGPPQPSGTISGILSGDWCVSGATHTYSVGAMTGATSYIWTNPVGTTILSGQGTTSISLQINPGFTSGSLSVKAVNACGPGANRTVTIQSSISRPIVIFGNTTVCNGTPYTYSTSSVPGATSYVWTLPTGWSGSSNTLSIIATPNNSSGYVRVAARNTCVTSANFNLSVTYGSCKTDETEGAALASKEEPLEGYVKVYPNPFTNEFTVEFTANSESETEILVHDVAGRLVTAYHTKPIEGLNRITLDLSKESAGLYFVSFKQDDFTKRIKMVKE